MVDYLSIRLEYEKSIGHLPRICFYDRVKIINHGQFVDDTILGGGASMAIAKMYKRVLDEFLAASRGSVKQTISYIYS